MKKIEPFDWEEIDKRLRGMMIGEAVKIVCYEIVQKMNELIDAHNKDHDET